MLKAQNLTKRSRKIVESVELQDDDARRSQHSAEKESEEGQEHDQQRFATQHIRVQPMVFTGFAVHRVNRHT